MFHLLKYSTFTPGHPGERVSRPAGAAIASKKKKEKKKQGKKDKKKQEKSDAVLLTFHRFGTLRGRKTHRAAFDG